MKSMNVSVCAVPAAYLLVSCILIVGALPARAQSKPKWIIAHKINQTTSDYLRNVPWVAPPNHYPGCFGNAGFLGAEESLDAYFDPNGNYTDANGFEFDVWQVDTAPGEHIDEYGADQEDIFGNPLVAGQWYVSHEPCDDEHVPIATYVAHLKSKLDTYGTARAALIYVDMKVIEAFVGYDDISSLRTALRNGLGSHYHNINVLYSTAEWTGRGAFLQNNFIGTLRQNELMGIDEDNDDAEDDDTAAATTAVNWMSNNGVEALYMSDDTTATRNEFTRRMNVFGYPHIVGGWTISSDDDTAEEDNSSAKGFWDEGVNLFLVQNYFEGTDGTGAYTYLKNKINGDPTCHLADGFDRPWVPPPVITCPPDVTVDCDGGDTSSAATGVATGSGECTGLTITESDVVTAGSCAGSSIITRTWTASDRCGKSTSCNQTIFVQDSAPPDFVGLSSAVYECDGAGNTDDIDTWLNGVSATDNCDGAPVVEHDYTGLNDNLCGAAGSALVTFTARDACGNERTETATIAIVDTTQPLLTIPADRTIECDESTLPADTGIAFATDVCFVNPTVTLNESVAPGGCPNEWTITRNWGAGDACENTSAAVQIVTVVDTTPPVITLPPDITVECGDSVDPAKTGWATATDNCDASLPEPEFADSALPGTCSTLPAITREWTVGDVCGNIASASQTITVVDTIPPAITCPGDVTVMANAACNATLPDFTGSALVSDTCAAVTVSQDPPPGTVIPAPGEVLVTLSADDGCTTPSECTLNVSLVCPAKNDFDGDRVADITVFDRTDATFYTRSSSGGSRTVAQLGDTDDVPVPGDYDGDGRTDHAVFDYATGNWTVLESTTGLERIQQFGYFDTVPVPGDYDGDGKTDFAVYERATFTWYFLQSTAGFLVQPWGFGDSVPVACDYDGDGKDDVAVYEPLGATWYVRQSTDGQLRVQPWGFPGVIPVPGDYDGDGLCDIAVYDLGLGQWFVLQSTDGSRSIQNFGYLMAHPVGGDYDGDLLLDRSVFDITNLTWFMLRSTQGFLAQQWGGLNMEPALPQYQINKAFGLQ